MQPKISVIIPCYNQGHFLYEALESLKKCDQSLFETIIINDGSTDTNTNAICRELDVAGFKVVNQENMGLSGARNTAITHAKGEYILLLDADNMIRPGYIEKSIKVLDQNPNVAVVYSNAVYFGDETGIAKPGEFNMQRLMLSNYIDACAVVRKSVFSSVGYYDTKMRSGWEDWDLWLRIAFAGYDFKYINEELFDYRVLKNSMARTLYSSYIQPNEIENYIHEKYPSKMGHSWIVNLYVKRFKKNPVLFLIKLFLRTYFLNYYNKLLKNNKIRNGL